MSNIILTPDVIAEEMAILLHNKVQWIHMVDRQYDKEFAKEEVKIGDTLRIRVPSRNTVNYGPAFSAQGVAERGVYLQLSDVNQTHVDLSFTTKELTLKLDNFSDRILEPAISSVASNVEANALKQVVPGIGNVIVGSNTDATVGPVAVSAVGSAGYVPAAVSRNDFLRVAAKLDEGLAPRDGRYCLISPRAQVGPAASALTLFNPRQEIAGIYEEGYIGNFANAEFGVSTLLPKYPILPAGTQVAQGADPIGASTGTATSTITVLAVNNSNSLPVSFAQVTSIKLQFPVGMAGRVVKAGTAFQVQGITSVNPELFSAQASNNYTFAVAPAYISVPTNGEIDNTSNADYTIAGDGSVTVNLAYILYDSTSGGLQNISALPGAGAKVFVLGSEVTALDQAIYFHPRAFAFSMADLVMPTSVKEKSRADIDGLRVRYLRQYVITAGDSEGARFDALWGAVMVRPELAGRVIGAVSSY